MCFWRLQHPLASSAQSSSTYSLAKGLPALTGGPPPCILSARTVATITAHLGLRPDSLHLILKNFSIPISAPNPASVTTNPSGPTSLRAISSATTELFPVAMFAKGPAWTRTGVRSTVCINVGMRASFISTVNAPPQPRSSAVMGCLDLLYPMIIPPSFSRRPGRFFARARTAITSDATVMSNPASRWCCRRGASGGPPGGGFTVSFGPWPIVTRRKCLSQVSRTRFHVMVDLSMSSRAKADFSSGLSSSGFFVSSMPSFFNLRRIMGLKSLPLEQSLRKRASSVCDSS
mmetsp:Transcript_22467/g.53260  ORF Transcript_22467/g.53260 Transcript_22467/m.53260 type:complete len:289 (+) Transcript_22467:718-1584(+)